MTSVNGNSDGRDVFAAPKSTPPATLPTDNDRSRSRSAPTSNNVTPDGQSPTSVVQSNELNVKIENFKSWSVNTFKCTKQMLQEKLGKSTRTVDTEMERKIVSLRDIQSRYRVLQEIARNMCNHFRCLLTTQHCLGDVFSELVIRQPELSEEFKYNADTQKSLVQNGEPFLAAMDHFLTTLDTLINKTIEDTLLTVRQYEKARVEYDTYRVELETTNPNTPKYQDAQAKMDLHRTKFEKLRDDIDVKMKLLDENRMRVMQKQLLLFNNAISSYFSGNKTALEATMKQFNLTANANKVESNSFLEQR